MITSYELPVLFREQLPELEESHRELKPLLRVFALVNDFTDFTTQAVLEHHYLLAGRCFLLAEKMYRQGDRMIRSLIRNGFIAGFPGFLPEEDKERMFVRSLIPVALYQLYESRSEEPSSAGGYV